MQSEGAVLMAAGLPHPTLASLELEDNGIEDSGADAIAAALRRGGSLSRLGLAENEIGARGARAIAASISVTTARAVSVSVSGVLVAVLRWVMAMA